MESSWRWNVYGSGWTLSSVELFARLPDSFFGEPAAVVRLGPSPVQGAIYLPSLEGWSPFISFEPTAEHPHFPFGFPATQDYVDLT